MMDKIFIKAVIFDFDGVIADTGSDIAAAIQYTLRHFSAPVLTEKEILAYVGNGMEKLIRSVFEGSSEETVRKAIPFYRDYYLSNCTVNTKLYDKTVPVLDYFSSKKIGLVTNKPESMTYSILKKFNIADRFDMVVGPESVTKLKPDPEGLLKVLGHFGINSSDAVMAGDSYTDILAGKNAGMRTCGITLGLGDPVELLKAKPDVAVEDIGGMIQYYK